MKVEERALPFLEEIFEGINRRIYLVFVLIDSTTLHEFEGDSSFTVYHQKQGFFG
jgi:hypothetical protein